MLNMKKIDILSTKCIRVNFMALIVTQYKINLFFLQSERSCSLSYKLDLET